MGIKGINRVLELIEQSSYLTNKVPWVLLNLTNAIFLCDSSAVQNIGSQQKY